MAVKYDFLIDHPEQIDDLGSAIYYQWEDMYKGQGKSVAEVTETVRARAVKSTLPITMVAVDGDTVLGSVTIKVNDFASHPELTPWIAGVFVKSEFRGNGYGKGLISFAEKVANEQFDVSEIYLYTGSASKLYEKVGYETFDSVDRGDKVLTLMKKSLG